MGLATVESQYLEGRAVLNCSDVTAAAVDEEVRKIMEDCYNEAKAILSENMDAMDMIAEQLIREETITGKDFMRLYRQAKGLPEDGGENKETGNSEKLEAKAQPVIEEKPAEAPAAAEPEAQDDEEEEKEKPAKSTEKGKFTKVPLEDLDRFFKE